MSNQSKKQRRLHKQSNQVKDESEEEKSSPVSDDPLFNKQRKRLQKGASKGGVSRFFEDEAEEGESDNETDKVTGNLKDQYYQADDLKRKTKTFHDKLAEMERREKKKQRVHEASKYDAEGNQIESEEDEGYLSPDEEQSVARVKQELLPSVSDPKLWQVRVKKGKEKIAAVALINKAMDYAEHGRPLEILSSTWTENVDDYIFVEAFKRASVVEAIAGLNFFYNKIDIISLNEMPKIFETHQQSQKSLPKAGQFVRIASGLYDKDLAIVEKVISDDKVFVKLIPRVEPPSKNKVQTQKKFRSFARPMARAFSLQLFPDCQRLKPPGFNKMFYQFRGHLFRKGFEYKKFSMKQLQCQNVRPTIDERALFLDIYEQHVKANKAEESSDIDPDETRKMLKYDFSDDLGVSDKIQVVKGELNGTLGVITSLEANQVAFKPMNLEGFEDILEVGQDFVEKYFETGDSVRIINGRYKGETGIVTEVGPAVKIKDDENFAPQQQPVVKLDKTDREIRVNKFILKLRTETDNEMQKLLEASHVGAQKEVYMVGETILFQSGKVYGYIIQVMNDMLRVVSDQGEIVRVRMTEIDKRFPYDRKAIARDSVGNILGLDDVVKCNGENSKYRYKKGIIKNVCKACIFLWDPKDFAASNGIFVEKPSNTLILGTEFLKGDGDNVLASQNRIVRDKLQGKVVKIMKGYFKGQRGRVTQMNGEIATIELSTRPQKITVQRTEIEECDIDAMQGSRYDGGQSVYGGYDNGGGKTAYGNQSVYGGQTAYDAGKTPRHLQTPLYHPAPMTPGRENKPKAGWGDNTDYGGNTAYGQNKGWGEEQEGGNTNWGGQTPGIKKEQQTTSAW